MVIKNKNWFTLIELIVVISIIAIISTISFISLVSYVSFSRDSKRIIDISSISSALDISAKKNWYSYPVPSKSIVVTYSSWSQQIPFSYLWYIDDDLKLDFNKVPLDPLTWDYYVYGLTKNKKYYQLWATVENNNAKELSYNPIITKTYADSSSLEYAYIYWNYKQDVSIGNYLSWLIVLTNDSWNSYIPKSDINIWEINWNNLTLSSSWIISINLSQNVPYSLYKKIDNTSTWTTDFYITTQDVSLTCPNCQ